MYPPVASGLTIDFAASNTIENGDIVLHSNRQWVCQKDNNECADDIPNEAAVDKGTWVV